MTHFFNFFFFIFGIFLIRQLSRLIGDEPLHVIIDSRTEPNTGRPYIGILLRVRHPSTGEMQDWAIECFHHESFGSPKIFPHRFMQCYSKSHFSPHIATVTTSKATNDWKTGSFSEFFSDAKVLGCVAQQVNQCVKYAFSSHESAWLRRLTIDPSNNADNLDSTTPSSDWNNTRWHDAFLNVRRFMGKGFQRGSLNPPCTLDDVIAGRWMANLLRSLSLLTVAVTQAEIDGIYLESSCPFGAHYRYIFRCIWDICKLSVKIPFDQLRPDELHGLINFSHLLLQALKVRFLSSPTEALRLGYALAMGPILKIGIGINPHDTEELESFMKVTGASTAIVEPALIKEVTEADLEVESSHMHEKDSMPTPPIAKTTASSASILLSPNPVSKVSPQATGPKFYEFNGSEEPRPSNKTLTSTPKSTRSFPSSSSSTTMYANTPSDSIAPENYFASSSEPPTWTQSKFYTWLKGYMDDILEMWKLWNDKDEQKRLILKRISTGSVSFASAELDSSSKLLDSESTHRYENQLKTLESAQSDINRFADALSWCAADEDAPAIRNAILQLHSIPITTSPAQNLFSVAKERFDSSLSDEDFDTRVLIDYNSRHLKWSEMEMLLGLHPPERPKASERLKASATSKANPTASKAVSATSYAARVEASLQRLAEHADATRPKRGRPAKPRRGRPKGSTSKASPATISEASSSAYEAAPVTSEASRSTFVFVDAHPRLATEKRTRASHKNASTAAAVLLRPSEASLATSNAIPVEVIPRLATEKRPMGSPKTASTAAEATSSAYEAAPVTSEVSRSAFVFVDAHPKLTTEKRPMGSLKNASTTAEVSSAISEASPATSEAAPAASEAALATSNAIPVEALPSLATEKRPRGRPKKASDAEKRPRGRPKKAAEPSLAASEAAEASLAISEASPATSEAAPATSEADEAAPATDEASSTTEAAPAPSKAATATSKAVRANSKATSVEALERLAEHATEKPRRGRPPKPRGGRPKSTAPISQATPANFEASLTAYDATPSDTFDAPPTTEEASSTPEASPTTDEAALATDEASSTPEAAPAPSKATTATPKVARAYFKATSVEALERLAEHATEKPRRGRPPKRRRGRPKGTGRKIAKTTEEDVPHDLDVSGILDLASDEE